MASNTVLIRSIWVSNEILVKLSTQNGGNKSFVCWRCTDWQGMCFPTKNNNIVIFQSLFSNKTKVFSWNKDTGLSIFWFVGNLCQNQWAQPWVKHGGGSGRNDALREYYIQLCNKWTPKIVFWAKITVLAIFLSSDFRPLSVGGYPPFYVKKCLLLFWENIVRGISVTFFIDYFSKFDPCHPHLRSFFLLFCRPRSIILASNLLLVWRKNSSHL